MLWWATGPPHCRHPDLSMALRVQGSDSLCLFSFPGGKCDPADQDVVHTALRETQEELGLAVPEEHVWGLLRPVYDPVSHLAEATAPSFTHSVPALELGPHGPGEWSWTPTGTKCGGVPLTCLVTCATPHNPLGRDWGSSGVLSRGGPGRRGGPSLLSLVD